MNDERIIELLEQIEKNTRPKARTKREKPSEGYSEDFETFWAAYPRKIGKGAAWKVCQKLNPPHEATMKMLVLCKQTIWKGKELQFIPHPATWLNQRRWEDEPDSKPVKEVLPCIVCGKPSTMHIDGQGAFCTSKCRKEHVGW